MPGTMPKRMTFAVEKMTAGGKPSAFVKRVRRKAKTIAERADVLHRRGDVAAREQGEEFRQELRRDEVDNDEEQDDRKRCADLQDTHAHLLFHVDAS